MSVNSPLGERQINIKSSSTPLLILQRTAQTGDSLMSFKTGPNNVDTDGVIINFGVVQYNSGGTWKYKLVVARDSNSIILADNL